MLVLEDCELFYRLFIACKSREGSLDEFFTFENQPWPPSLAQGGKLRSGQKADLIKCILNQAADPSSNFQADAIILDGAVIVQMLPVKTAQTFDEYFNAIFAPYVLHQLETANNNNNNNNICLFPPFADFSELQVGSGKALTTIQL